MHGNSPFAGAPLHVSPRTRRSRAGFSLVEIATSIGIIAFAFVSLIGLLPTGLQVFREAIDSTNETWIAQSLNSMIQVTPWSKIGELERYTFFFDEEGRLTDRISPEDETAADEFVIQRRLYAVKLLIVKHRRPGDSGAALEGGGANEFSENVARVVMVIAPYHKPAAMKELAELSQMKDLQKLGKRSGLKTRAFLVTRMDSMRESATR